MEKSWYIHILITAVQRNSRCMSWKYPKYIYNKKNLIAAAVQHMVSTYFCKKKLFLICIYVQTSEETADNFWRIDILVFFNFLKLNLY